MLVSRAGVRLVQSKDYILSRRPPVRVDRNMTRAEVIAGLKTVEPALRPVVVKMPVGLDR
jgi:hypothetical protein